MRGEDVYSIGAEQDAGETPPRAWRRLFRHQYCHVHVRNTSTCVEKISSCSFSRLSIEKHLHVRGEDRSRCCRPESIQETPPRAWRRLPEAGAVPKSIRNTSTCVEKIVVFTSIELMFWKHLHVRGEDVVTNINYYKYQETPPRAWRRLLYAAPRRCFSGNTSTCVEKIAIP